MQRESLFTIRIPTMAVILLLVAMVATPMLAQQQAQIFPIEKKGETINIIVIDDDNHPTYTNKDPYSVRPLRDPRFKGCIEIEKMYKEVGSYFPGKDPTWETGGEKFAERAAKLARKANKKGGLGPNAVEIVQTYTGTQPTTREWVLYMKGVICHCPTKTLEALAQRVAEVQGQ